MGGLQGLKVWYRYGMAKPYQARQVIKAPARLKEEELKDGG